MNHPSPELEEIYKNRFEPATAAALKKSRLGVSRAPVACANALTEKLLRDLLERRICAIHIPGYCDRRLAASASSAILRRFKTRELNVRTRKETRKTDQNLMVAVPRSARSARFDPFATPRELRDIFSPMLSPLDRLQLELNEIWPEGASIHPFEEVRKTPGVVFVVKPTRISHKGIASTRGVAHRDSGVASSILSANTYLNMPGHGGELLIWPVPLDERTEKNPLYQLLGSSVTFDLEVQEVIHSLLPKPIVISPKNGDLVIFDTARPHAVCSIADGRRISIQTFFRRGSDGHLLIGS